jgi:trk system potassium uptake protein TrkA
MNIIVVGAGRVGSALADQLSKKGHKVTVIHSSSSGFQNLPPGFRGRKIEGDVLTQDVLARAEIDKADGLAAVTDSESLNAVVAHMARSIYKIPNVVVRNYDPRWLPLHNSLDYQVVSAASWDVQSIEDLLSDTWITALFSGSSPDISVYELVLPEVWNGCKVEELFPSGEFQIVGMTRDGKAVLPESQFELVAGDVLYVKATHENVEALLRRMNSKQES